MSGMEWPIRSYESVGPIHFGMSVRNARAALAEPLRALGKGWALTQSFLKDPRRDDLPTDDFSDVGLHLYYRIDGHRLVVDAVEIFPPANPTLDGFPLLGQRYAAVRDFLRRLDPAAEIDVDGAKSSRFGVSLYDGSCGEEPDEPPGSVFVCSRGYWERPLAPLADGEEE